MTDFTITRRALLALPGGLAGAWPSIVAAQRAEQVRRLHVMLGFAASDADARSRVSTLQQELGSLGWNEGLNIQIEYRWAGAVAERIQSLAMEPVGTIPDVIVAHSTPIAEALRREARTIPMVFLLVSDPIGSGLTTNLTTPDRNATGFTSFSPSVGTKWVEFLKQLRPTLGRVGMLYNPETAPAGGTTFLGPVEAAARSITVEPVILAVRSSSEIGDAITAIASDPVGGLIVMPDVFTTVHREQIVDLVNQLRLPTIYPFRNFAASGGLISYGIDVSDLFRRTASYVDKILRGANPSSLPIRHPDKFELVINTKTAKALSVDVPRILLARADELIQ